jgi:ribonuclease Z
MNLHCLGTGGYHPSERRHTSCFFVPQWNLLLDAGTGIFRLPPLLRSKRLDIVLSHSHLDHTFGLTVLLDIVYQHPLDSIHVWVQSGKVQAIRDHLFHPEIFPAAIPVIWHPIEAGQSFDLPDVSVCTREQDHPGGSLAFRMQDSAGRSLVYATDTTGDAGDSFAAWAHRPDLLIHECYFRDTHRELAHKTGHTYVSRMIEVANKIQPKTLLVTHVNPLEVSNDPIDMATIVSKVDCQVVLATDHLVLPFGNDEQP